MFCFRERKIASSILELPESHGKEKDGKENRRRKRKDHKERGNTSRNAEKVND